MSWLGNDYKDMGWVEVEGELPPTATKAEKTWERAKQLLRESDWAVLPDVPMTHGKRADWIEYRRQVREIRLHPDFPDMVWPVSPE